VPSHTGNEQPQGQGVTNTGNPDGAPSTAGNTTTTSIPDGPSQDNLAYKSEGNRPENYRQKVRVDPVLSIKQNADREYQ
jgi:hypothetical protein